MFTPEDILPAGEDHTLAINPFTGFQGRARKGTVAATLNNIALLDLLLQDNTSQDQVADIKRGIEALMPSLKAVGMFDLFCPLEWICNPDHLGRTYVALLYLKHYPNEITKEIREELKLIQNPYLRAELA